MGRLRYYLIAALGCVVLAGTITVFNPRNADAQGGPPPLNVNVINTASAPVPVRNIDDFAAKNAYSTTIVAEIADGGQICPGVNVAAPAGKRFVIEHVSARALLPSGQQLEQISLVANVANAAGVPRGQVNQFKHLVPFETGPGTFVASQDLRAYADELGIACLRSAPTGVGTATLVVSGYVADVP